MTQQQRRTSGNNYNKVRCNVLVVCYQIERDFLNFTRILIYLRVYPETPQQREERLDHDRIQHTSQRQAVDTALIRAFQQFIYLKTFKYGNTKIESEMSVR